MLNHLRRISLLGFMALWGCEPKPQVDYSPWKEAAPELEINLQDVSLGQPIEKLQSDDIPVIKVGQLVRFRGVITRPAESDVAGCGVSLRFIQIRAGREFSANGAGAVVSFHGGAQQPYEILLQSPEKPGQYTLTMSIGGEKHLAGSVRVNSQ